MKKQHRLKKWFNELNKKFESEQKARNTLNDIEELTDYRFKFNSKLKILSLLDSKLNTIDDPIQKIELLEEVRARIIRYIYENGFQIVMDKVDQLKGEEIIEECTLIMNSITKEERAPKMELNKQQQKKPETLPDLLICDKPNQIAEGLKKHLKGKKGVTFRLLFEALHELKYLPIKRNYQEFHNCCQGFFNWDIGTRQSISSPVIYIEKSGTHEDEYKRIIELLQKLS